ncbi:flavodoxin [Ferrimonas balearica]|uniref:flavodoxin n=1 Tax=Ferrimonas balearica TaxID=44012 RepID=UPI001C99D496|nr:flavodoxin [Ferrimonas balearica]MBY5990651.1 flavodoxin [Ferrimonas balearica]
MAAFYLVVGSVYGAAEHVSEEVMAALTAQGHQASLLEGDDPELISGLGEGSLLVITSTTGSGDLPDNLAPLFFALKDRFPLLPNLRYGVIALGDSSYGETFCGAGRQFDELLTELGAKRVGERLQIDACETFEPEAEALKWLPQWLEQLERLPVSAA